ncbi:MAG: peptidase MA family metallohydrolase [Candidatus Latescibacterota bacterium]
MSKRISRTGIAIGVMSHFLCGCFLTEAWCGMMNRITFGTILWTLLLPVVAAGGFTVPLEKPNGSRPASDLVSVFSPSGEEIGESEARDMVEEAYESVARGVGYSGTERVRVFLPRSEEEFNRLTGGRIPDWGGGCAFPEQGIIVIRASSEGVSRLREILRHELSHVFLRRALGEKQVPRWFEEGVSMMQSGEWRMEHTLRMARAVLLRRIMTLDQIDRVLLFRSSKAQLAYVESYLAVLYFCHLGGREAPQRLIGAMQSGMSFEEAFSQVAGMRASDFSGAWEQYAKDRYDLVLVVVEGPWFWIGMSLLFLGSYLAKRIRTGRVVRTWENEEATR